jgi:hypothetical protein
MSCSYFYYLLRDALWALIFEGSKCHFKKKSRATRHRQQPSINKVTIVGPRTSQQSDTALTIHFAK